MSRCHHGWPLSRTCVDCQSARYELLVWKLGELVRRWNLASALEEARTDHGDELERLMDDVGSVDLTVARTIVPDAL